MDDLKIILRFAACQCMPQFFRIFCGFLFTADAGLSLNAFGEIVFSRHGPSDVLKLLPGLRSGKGTEQAHGSEENKGNAQSAKGLMLLDNGQNAGFETLSGHGHAGCKYTDTRCVSF